ncbi:MAG TPA: glycosyltransferase [Streptosporangiaceae bacterium]|nr:glycosyltransferase [Streptosporangiaceae bacterium]
MLLAVAASALAVLAWLYLLAGHGGFWRTDQRLPGARQEPVAAWPGVVAVIPARDEADVLPQALPTLLAQEYPGEFTVVLVDDESSDGTAQVAVGLSKRPGAGARLRVVSGAPPPPGWAGKVWAMAQGLRHAGDAEYVLFTDADIAYAPGIVTALVRSAQATGHAMVSQLALLRTQTFAERLLIPAFVYFFAQLYPFRRVNRRTSRTAAAAGGCMLVRREALEKAGGLEPIRGARIDDVALGGLLKRGPEPAGCWLGFSTGVVSCREYTGVAQVWDMVARSAYTQLRYSPAALAATVVGLAWIYLLPVVAAAGGLMLLAGGDRPAAWLAATGLAGWVIMSATYVPILRLSGLSGLRAPCLPLIAVLYTGMTVSSAWRHHAGRGGEWKGRTI